MILSSSKGHWNTHSQCSWLYYLGSLCLRSNQQKQMRAIRPRAASPFYIFHERFFDCFLSHVTEILEISIPARKKNKQKYI